MNILRKLTGYRTRASYWSNSKLSHKLQQWAGMEKSPASATAKEWRLLSERQRAVNPIVYWITEDGFNIVQNILYFPSDVYRNLKAKFHNIFISKPHYIRTKLPVGEWHECNTRILHGLCELVVHFVETEKAHMYDISVMFDESGSRPTIKDRREAGLAYLDWEISLGEESPGQSHTAKEIKEIYLWWKDIRPARIDPHDESGWSDYCATKEHILEINDDEDETNSKHVRSILDRSWELEKQYNDEDTEMLIRIVRVREGMWT